jgi:transcriptional regulator of acetoin/glycerol metabolism
MADHYVIVDVSQPLKVARARAMRAFERAYLVELLARVAGNVTAGARAAGIDRVHFYRLLWKHGLK